MSDPWFFAAVPIDAAALASLRAVALGAASALDAAADRRLRSATVGLARCAGPFADDLAEALLRAAARDRALADDCRDLAARAATAVDAGAAEQVRRRTLQDVYRAELERDAARAAGASTADGLPRLTTVVGLPSATSGTEAA